MEKLYNGIELPNEWPPQYAAETLKEKLPVPYLTQPPSIINIDVGRQLFVDDFLIESTTLKPCYHKAIKYEGNPVMYPETPWEKDEVLPCACPKSGGVWWDEEAQLYKMWYEAGWIHQLAYATSRDGLHWERPNLEIEPGTNKILLVNKADAAMTPPESYFLPDSTTVFIDKDCADKSQRYKLFLRNPGAEMPGLSMTSSDGIHWDDAVMTSPLGDRSTIFYNPFRKKWVYSIRSAWNGRTRDYAESDDFLRGASWGNEQVKWLCTDSADKPNAYIGFAPQLYNIDAVAYESIMLGMFQIMYGPENDVCKLGGVPKITELIPMYSRDGFHFSRPSNESIIQASMVKGSWDRGYIQSVGGICLVMGDELWIYYIGFSGDETHQMEVEGDWTFDGMYSGGATGIAKLRRDGFVSMHTDACGQLLTRPVMFTNKRYLFVNFSGELTVEIYDMDGKLLATSEMVNGDSTKQLIVFNDYDISLLSGQPIRIRSNLNQGDLYAFWFSDSTDGRSGGYLGAGAPKDE